jgi:hypothetical protein
MSRVGLVGKYNIDVVCIMLRARISKFFSSRYILDDGEKSVFDCPDRRLLELQTR